MDRVYAEKAESETFVVCGLPAFLHEFAAESLVFPVKDGGRLLVIFALFPFADNTLFFDHALEALDCFFEVLGFVDNDMSHVKITSPRSDRQYPDKIAEKGNQRQDRSVFAPFFLTLSCAGPPASKILARTEYRPRSGFSGTPWSAKEIPASCIPLVCTRILYLPVGIECSCQLSANMNTVSGQNARFLHTYWYASANYR